MFRGLGNPKTYQTGSNVKVELQEMYSLDFSLNYHLKQQPPP